MRIVRGARSDPEQEEIDALLEAIEESRVLVEEVPDMEDMEIMLGDAYARLFFRLIAIRALISPYRAQLKKMLPLLRRAAAVSMPAWGLVDAIGIYYDNGPKLPMPNFRSEQTE